MTLWCAKNTFLGGYNTRILLPPILLKTHVKLLCRSFFINTNRGVQVWPAQTVWAKLKTVWPNGWWQVSSSRNWNRRVDLRVFTWKIESNRPPLRNLPFITLPFSLKRESDEFCQDLVRSLWDPARPWWSPLRFGQISTKSGHNSTSQISTIV